MSEQKIINAGFCGGAYGNLWRYDLPELLQQGWKILHTVDDGQHATVILERE